LIAANPLTAMSKAHDKIFKFERFNPKKDKLKSLKNVSKSLKRPANYYNLYNLGPKKAQEDM